MESINWPINETKIFLETDWLIIVNLLMRHKPCLLNGHPNQAKPSQICRSTDWPEDHSHQPCCDIPGFFV